LRSELLKLQRRLFRQKFAALPVFLITGFRTSPLVEDNIQTACARIKTVDMFLQKYGLIIICLSISVALTCATYISIEVVYGYEAFGEIIISYASFWLDHFLAKF